MHGQLLGGTLANPGIIDRRMYWANTLGGTAKAAAESSNICRSQKPVSDDKRGTLIARRKHHEQVVAVIDGLAHAMFSVGAAWSVVSCKDGQAILLGMVELDGSC